MKLIESNELTSIVNTSKVSSSTEFQFEILSMSGFDYSGEYEHTIPVQSEHLKIQMISVVKIRQIN